MFKPYYGICTGKDSGKTRYQGCGKSGLIKTKRLLCESCEAVRKPPKPLARTPIKQKIRKATGEGVLFESIAELRAHVCFVTRRIVHVYNPDRSLNVSCFAHVLSKGAYPAFRLYDKNIVILDPEIHHIYDAGNASQRKDMEKYPGWHKLLALASELKTEYYADKTPPNPEMPW